jgi:Hsp70 protein
VTYAAGIDVGTTFSAAATWRDGRAATVALGDRAATVPSVLFLRDDGIMLVGEAAVRRAVAGPQRVVREFKRRIGDAVPVVLGDRRFGAAELTAHVVRWVVDRVTEREGGRPDYAVLTHPASWGQHRLSVLAEAAALAGLPNAGLLPEPVAAGLYYASRQRVPAGSLVAVYDLGGGTFDATLLRKSTTSFEIIGAPRGDDRLGGVDVDQAVLDHVVAAMGDAWPDVAGDDPALLSGLAQVRAAAVDAKEALSSDTHATVPVVLPGCTSEVRLTRPELERMAAPVVLHTVDLVRQTCQSAGVGADQLDACCWSAGRAGCRWWPSWSPASWGVRWRWTPTRSTRSAWERRSPLRPGSRAGIRCRRHPLARRRRSLSRQQVSARPSPSRSTSTPRSSPPSATGGCPAPGGRRTRWSGSPTGTTRPWSAWAGRATPAGTRARAGGPSARRWAPWQRWRRW